MQFILQQKLAVFVGNSDNWNFSSKGNPISHQARHSSFLSELASSDPT